MKICCAVLEWRNCRKALACCGCFDVDVTATDQLVKEVAGLVRGNRDDVKAKVSDALERIKQLEKENRSLKDKLASGQGTDLSAGAKDIAGVKLVSALAPLAHRRGMILTIAPSDGTGAAATRSGGDFGGRCLMGSFKVSIC